MFRPTSHRLPRGGNRCDFCSSLEVSSLYACSNFDWEGKPVFQEPSGRWAACWLCSGYIDEQRWGQITRRVMREVAKRSGITPAQLEDLRASLKVLHALFAKHVVRGEELKIHNPRVRRFVVA
jgi:hypothetical protein